VGHAARILVVVVAMSAAARADSTIVPAVPPAPEPAPPSVKWDDPEPVFGGAQRVSGKERDDVIAFTFDDGPNEDTTPLVLDALAKYDVPATFFVVSRAVSGKKGAARRAILLRAVAEGYTIGSHTVNHPNLTGLEKKAKHREIDVSLKQLTAVLQTPVGMFRPPFGALDAEGSAHLRKRKLTDVRWHIDSKDFRHPNPKKLRARVAKQIAAGGRGIFLFHDTKQSTARAIEGILDDLEAMNCARLEAGEAPILPVSVHYFLRDDGVPRPVPEAVEARTQRYRDALPGRCAARPKPEQPVDPKADEPPSSGD
jgi:peptidoglycan/xylan/chitin deacetylase (PgdA/CDA1 family)